MDATHLSHLPATTGNFPAPSRAQGFSLVELMVGVLIGLIGVLVIMQAFEVNEGYKRSTGGTGQAQANGAIGLFAIEREARMAGYGIANSNALGCGTIQWYYEGAYSSPPGPAGGGALPPLVLAPIQIINGGAAGTDEIIIMYGSAGDRAVPTSAVKTGTPPPNAAEIGVEEIYGYADNDLIVIVQDGMPPPTKTCTLYNITDTQVIGGGGTFRLQKNPGKGGPFNPPGNGLFTDYTPGALVFNLGQLTVNRYSISNSDLLFTPILTTPSAASLPTFNNTPQVLVNDIVDMKAWYGKDTTATPDGIVDTWDKVTPTTADEWLRVTAVRVALLARSGNYEKPEQAGDPCRATLSTGATSESIKYTDPSSAAAPPANRVLFNAIPGGLPSCYKYRTFETVVPLRNMIWKF